MAKSQYVGPSKKLKVTNKVCTTLHCPMILLHFGTKDLLTPFWQVDPDIIGGLVVEIGDRTIDLSVSSRLTKMNKLLTDAL